MNCCIVISTDDDKTVLSAHQITISTSCNQNQLPFFQNVIVIINIKRKISFVIEHTVYYITES